MKPKLKKQKNFAFLKIEVVEPIQIGLKLGQKSREVSVKHVERLVGRERRRGVRRFFIA